MCINCICIGVTIIAVVVLCIYKRQVRKMCKQLEVLQKNDSNLLVSLNIHFKELEKLADHINKNNTYCRKRNIECENRDRMLKQAITNISHDIRTPLTSLNGYFELLQLTNDKSEKERYYQIIQERIHYLKEMLEQLFTYVKLQNGDYDFDLKRVDAKELLCKTIFTFYDDIKEKNIEPVIELPDEPTYGLLNGFALIRVYQNIIKNAMDHADRELIIKMITDDQNIVIRFTNSMCDGEIIEPDKVFNRFYRGEQSKSQTSTGLGLSIAKEMVEKMDGEIEAYIKENQFTIEIKMPLLRNKQLINSEKD